MFFVAPDPLQKANIQIQGGCGTIQQQIQSYFEKKERKMVNSE
jgi:hypothetical protein